MNTGSEEINLYEVPLNALRFATRNLIVDELNKKKVLLSEEKKPRDFRGLADLCRLPEPSGDNPTKQLLVRWEENPQSSIGRLQEFLGRLDRWDIVDDVKDLLGADAREFYHRNVIVQEEKQKSLEDAQVLTHDDASKLQRGEPLTEYDVLLLFADTPTDQEYAELVMDQLESRGLSVCKIEDLVGGFMFEHQGAIRLISERCRHVVVIVTQSFLNSPTIQFLVHFAQALAIQKQSRIIIPCLFERNLRLPDEMNILHKLDYSRHQLMGYHFWDRLVGSVQSPAPIVLRPALTITEIASTSVSNLKVPSSKSMINLTALDQPSTSQKHGTRISVTDTSPVSNLTTSSLTLSHKKTKTKSPAVLMRKLLQSFKVPKSSKKVAVATECC